MHYGRDLYGYPSTVAGLVGDRFDIVGNLDIVGVELENLRAQQQGGQSGLAWNVPPQQMPPPMPQMPPQGMWHRPTVAMPGAPVYHPFAPQMVAAPPWFDPRTPFPGAVNRYGSTVVRDDPAAKVLRRQVMGFGSQSVAAGGTATFSASPQRTMRMEKLVIVPSAAGLLVTGINVGADPQFVNVGLGAPVELFSATTLDNLLRSVTANLGHVVTIQLQNPTGGQITASVGAIGEALD